jgi:hypothetical protein
MKCRVRRHCFSGQHFSQLAFQPNPNEIFITCGGGSGGVFVFCRNNLFHCCSFVNERVFHTAFVQDNGLLAGGVEQVVDINIRDWFVMVGFWSVQDSCRRRKNLMGVRLSIQGFSSRNRENGAGMGGGLAQHEG